MFVIWCVWVTQEANVYLNDEYNIPVWAAYAFFAVITIFLGAFIGLLFVCIVDYVWPPKRNYRKSFEETSKETVNEDYPDEDEDVVESEKSTSEGEKYSDSEEEELKGVDRKFAAEDTSAAGDSKATEKGTFIFNFHLNYLLNLNIFSKRR